MRKTLHILLAVITLSFTALEMGAQGYVQIPVTVSTEKVNVEGKMYYSHVVLEKQTLYSISKAYGVTPEQIIGANPAIKSEGLKKGAVILIPIIGEESVQPAKEDILEKDGKLYYFHVVLPKQTLYSLSREYGVQIKELYDANPGLEEKGLKKGAFLLIPVKDGTASAVAQQPGQKTAVAEQRPEEELTKAEQKEERAKEKERKRQEKDREKDLAKGYTVHVVKWYEDLDVISEKYNVPVAAIMKANGLTGRKLTNRQKLKIPLIAEEAQVPAPEKEAESVLPENADVSQPARKEKIKDEALFTYKRKDKVKASLIMPFNATAEKPSLGNLDFYCGALLAVKEISERGTDVELNVYDIVDGKIPVSPEKLRDNDVVIGPISTGDISRLLERCPLETTVVSPLDHRAEQLVHTHENFIQAPSSVSTQYADLVNWMKEERSHTDSVLFICQKGYGLNDSNTAMRNLLDASGMPYNTFSYSILEGRNILDSLKALMNIEAANRVIVVSESEAFVNDVVRNLNLLVHEKYDIVLYAPSKIRSFETIEVDNLHNAKLHTSSSYYIDYDDPQVKNFLLQYRALYNTEPTPFAFMGHDTAMYFIRLSTIHGKKWVENLQYTDLQMLQTDFKFRKAGTGQGYVNTAVRRIVYGEDYSVTLVD